MYSVVMPSVVRIVDYW